MIILFWILLEHISPEIRKILRQIKKQTLALQSIRHLNKIQKFSIAFFNFYDQAQIIKANDLMENHFYQLLFLSRLKN